MIFSAFTRINSTQLSASQPTVGVSGLHMRESDVLNVLIRKRVQRTGRGVVPSSPLCFLDLRALSGARPQLRSEYTVVSKSKLLVVLEIVN